MSSSDPIYLDHNATTPVLPEVVEAMLPYLRVHFGNPSSGHVYGRRARDAVARARQQVAALVGCDEDEVVFTSGGTEANNLAIRGVTEARGDRGHLLTTVIEHPATAHPCGWLERHGRRVTRIRVDSDGRVRAITLSPARNGPFPFRNPVSQAGTNPRKHSRRVCWWTTNLLLQVRWSGERVAAPFFRGAMLASARFWWL